MTRHDLEALSAMHDDAADTLELKRLLSRLDDSEVLAEWIRINRLSTAADASTASWIDVSVLEGVRAGIAQMPAPQDKPKGESEPVAASLQGLGVSTQRRWLGGASAAVAASFLIVMVLGQTGRQDGGTDAIATVGSQIGETGTAVQTVPGPGLLASAQRQTLERYYKRHREMSAQTLPSGSFELARLVSAAPFAQTYDLVQ